MDKLNDDFSLPNSQRWNRFICEECIEEFTTSSDFILKPHCPNCGKRERVKELEATNDSTIDYTPFMPAHGNYSDCCGIFDVLTEKGFVCNECGINLNELLTTNKQDKEKKSVICIYCGKRTVEI